jgi:TRAP-type C4-dicarboxylate transport system permease small subunit
MANDTQPAARGGRPRLDRLLRYPALISGWLLAGIMFLTAADVALRYLANAPIFGAFEVTELAMVALIMLALPYCGATGGHIRVDVLDRALGRIGRFVGDAVTGVIGLVILGFLIRRTILKALEAHEYEDLTNMLALPVWPVYGLIALGMGGYAVVILSDLIVLFRTGRSDEDE